MRETTRLVYTEAPGSLTFEMQDVPAIAASAHERGALVAMDNTWATPHLLPPPRARCRHLHPGRHEVPRWTLGPGHRDDHDRHGSALQDDRGPGPCVRGRGIPRRLLSRAARHAQPLRATGAPVGLGDEDRALAGSAHGGEAGALPGAGERPRPRAVEAGLRGCVELVRTRAAHHRRGGGGAHGERARSVSNRVFVGRIRKSRGLQTGCRSPASSIPGRRRRSCCACTSAWRTRTTSSRISRRVSIGSAPEHRGYRRVPGRVRVRATRAPCPCVPRRAFAPIRCSSAPDVRRR